MNFVNDLSGIVAQLRSQYPTNNTAINSYTTEAHAPTINLMIYRKKTTLSEPNTEICTAYPPF